MKQMIRQILDAYGLKQKELAFIMDVSPAVVCRWLKGYFEPEGGNRQLLYVIHKHTKYKTPNELKQIGQTVRAMAAIEPERALIVVIELLYG